MHRRALSIAAALPLALGAQQQPPQTAAPGTSIAGRTTGLDRQEGLIPLYVDRDGKVLLEIPRDSTRVLFFIQQATGLGSNPVGIDRGANGPEHVARFERHGDRVLLVLENWAYRGTSAAEPGLATTVAESFPQSTVAALPLMAAEGGRLLVDATDIVMRDWLDIAGTLQRTEQGSYLLARDRSSVVRAGTRSFPDNTEIDVALTYTSSGRTGPIVGRILPDPRAITLRQHLSFVRLPDASYRPRELDPRVGFFGITFRDYSQPIQGSLEQRWISRHRLQRADPRDPRGAIIKPIVYYIDPGIPEPLRTATVQGARFWEEAFDQAGLRGGFRVEMLPAGADPIDARYSTVLWVNRHERGWSFGGSQGDPRTGEIIKGVAHMDSHRARTDYNLYAGLMGAAAAAADTAFVLARIRQVTAHEIGHTIGMAHNYIASTYERGSVMDYPPPRVRLDASGNIDISQAYARGPGPYDVWALRYGYGIFPPESEADSLGAIIREGITKGYAFLSDGDARPENASDPRTNLWDDAGTAEEYLRHLTGVRRVAIARFGERNIRPGEPVAVLQERFAPVYFMHRFAINGLSKTIGGMEYSNAVRGDGLQATRAISGARQRAALTLLLAAIAPGELAIPDTVLTLFAPRPFGYEGTVELFGTQTRPSFDDLGAARTLSQMVIDGVLQRERAARLVQQSARDAAALSFGEAIDRIVTATWSRRTGPVTPLKYAALHRVTQRAVADRLLALAADREASPDVRALVEYRIRSLRDRARTSAASGTEADRAHWSGIAGDFTRWIERRELPMPTPALRPPPGDPFGTPPE